MLKTIRLQIIFNIYLSQVCVPLKLKKDIVKYF